MIPQSLLKKRHFRDRWNCSLDCSGDCMNTCAFHNSRTSCIKELILPSIITQTQLKKKKYLEWVVGPNMFSRLRHSVTQVLGILASVGLQLMSSLAFVEGSCLVQKSTSFQGTNPPTSTNQSMKKFNLRCLMLYVRPRFLPWYQPSVLQLNHILNSHFNLILLTLQAYFSRTFSINCFQLNLYLSIYFPRNPIQNY